MMNETALASTELPQVLVVDDHAGIRLLLTEALHREGYQVVAVADGREALRELGKKSFPLVMLDMKMPGMNGLEVLKQMRTLGDETPVLIMTAFGELDVIEQAKDMGVKGYLSKPFDIDDLNRLLHECIRK